MDLEPWNDPLVILDALTRAQREELPALRESLYGLINHDHPDIRLHAIRRLFVHLADRVHRVDAGAALTSDPEWKVRRAAAFAVASTSSETTKAEDISLLLARFLDEREELAVRGASYEALLLLHKRKGFPPVKREIDLAMDVDWNWINGLRRDLGMTG